MNLYMIGVDAGDELRWVELFNLRTLDRVECIVQTYQGLIEEIQDAIRFEMGMEWAIVSIQRFQQEVGAER